MMVQSNSFRSKGCACQTRPRVSYGRARDFFLQEIGMFSVGKRAAESVQPSGEAAVRNRSAGQLPELDRRAHGTKSRGRQLSCGKVLGLGTNASTRQKCHHLAESDLNKLQSVSFSPTPSFLRPAFSTWDTGSYCGD